MALVPSTLHGLDDPFLGLTPYAPAGMLDIVRNRNPFHKQEIPYHGPIGAVNPQRPLLRPENDRLDKLVQIALVKLETGIQTLQQLSSDCDTFRRSMEQSATGGSKELREQLSMANKEIYRLRTLMTQEGGAGDLDFVGRAAPDYQQQGEFVDQQYAEQEGQEETTDLNDIRRQYSFFGLTVTDGVKFREEYGGRHEYGAVKVIKVWGPAAVAGIMPMDFITHINDQQVSNLQEFNQVVTQIQNNQPVAIVVERNNREMMFIVHTATPDVATVTDGGAGGVGAIDGTGTQQITAGGAWGNRGIEGGADESQTLHL